MVSVRALHLKQFRLTVQAGGRGHFDRLAILIVKGCFACVFVYEGFEKSDSCCHDMEEIVVGLSQ